MHGQLERERIKTCFSFNKLDELFDVITISAEVKGKKVKEQIFNITLDKLKLEAKECVFIDNKEYNLVVPRKMGMKTILFNDESRGLTEIEEFLY